MLTVTVVAPRHNRATPLEPAFIVPQDGHEKQDCESRAARRWLAALNLLAFACHTACDLAVRRGLFQTLLALTAYLVFPSWEHLLQTMAFARPPTQAP